MNVHIVIGCPGLSSTKTLETASTNSRPPRVRKCHGLPFKTSFSCPKQLCNTLMIPPMIGVIGVNRDSAIQATIRIWKARAEKSSQSHHALLEIRVRSSSRLGKSQRIIPNHTSLQSTAPCSFHPRPPAQQGSEPNSNGPWSTFL